MIGGESKAKRVEVDTWCRNVGSFPFLPLPQCPKAPGYHGTDGTVCVCVGLGVCVCHQTSLSWQMMMKHTRDGTVEGTAKHTAGQIHTHSLSFTQTNTHTYTFTCIDILHSPTHTRKNTHTESIGCPQQGSPSVECQRQTRGLYSSHINNGPIWTSLQYSISLFTSTVSHTDTLPRSITAQKYLHAEKKVEENITYISDHF